MESLSTAEHLEHLTDEYRSLVGGLADDAQLREALVRDSDWTDEGAQAVAMLAKRYGSFVLANAIALAEALGIEDGEAGI